MAERLIRHRTSLGLTQKEAAKRMDVDPSTLARWERGEREPTGALLARATRFLSEPEGGRLGFRPSSCEATSQIAVSPELEWPGAIRQVADKPAKWI